MSGLGTPHSETQSVRLGRRLAALFILGSIASSLTGCLSGPDYRRPAALPAETLPQAFQGALLVTNTTGWKPAEPAADRPRGAWWEVFQDPELDRLETLAAASNQELAAAAARFAQARAFINLARSGLFPQLSLNPGYTRQRTSAGQPERGQAAGQTYTYNTFSVPLEASWELDLWGRVRRQVEAAQGRLQATADDTEAVRLAVQGEVATDYFVLRSLAAEHALLERSVETFRRSLELTRNRRAGGIAGDLDVAQAESQLRETEAQIPAVELQAARLNHALAVLCGHAATGFEVRLSEPRWIPAPAQPAGLPSELLERRPDISAAERRMAAANAEIGVAQTAFYPRVRLSGVAGFQSVDAGSLFDWPSRLWAIGPAIDLPLFTGGRNRAQWLAARAAYDETVAVYRQSVLSAFQEVEDGLAAGRLLATQLAAEEAALVTAQRTLEISNNRYRAGLVTYLEVAIAQSAALTRERTVVQLRSQRLIAAAGLIRAIGGGWDGGSSRQ